MYSAVTNSYSYKDMIEQEINVKMFHPPGHCNHPSRGCCSFLHGIQVQASGSSAVNLEINERIPFNLINTHSGIHMGFEAATRDVILKRPGTYLAIWWVVIDGTGSNPHANFSLTVNGIPNSMEVFPSGMATQLCGSSLIYVPSAPTSISVINSGTDMVTLGDTDIQSSLIVMAAF